MMLGWSTFERMNSSSSRFLMSFLIDSLRMDLTATVLSGAFFGQASLTVPKWPPPMTLPNL